MAPTPAQYRAAVRVIADLRDEAIRKGTATYLYAIQQGDGGPVKIGLARKVKARIKTLQCGNPEPLRLVAAWLTFPEHEKALHDLFAEYHIRGEWFEGAPDLIEFMVSHGSDPEDIA